MRKLNVKLTGKAKKAVISVSAGVAAVAIVAGIVFGLRGRGEPVGVYPFTMVGMTEFWGDNQESYGPVTTDRIQTVFLSDTQTVTEVLVKEGDTVKKGDVLMTYDTTLSELELERKRLDVEKAKLQVKEAEEELARINKLEPMGDVDIDIPTVSTDYGDTIQKVASGEDYMVVSDGKADGSSPEKPLVVWLSKDRPLDNGLLKYLYTRAVSLQNANPDQPGSSASAIPESSEPSASSEPSEPSAPSEPSVPTEPSAPSEPSVPTEPSAPSEPSAPTEPSAPKEPTTPMTPASPETMLDWYQQEMATLQQTAPKSISISSWSVVNGGVYSVCRGNAANLYFTTNITDPVHRKYVEFKLKFLNPKNDTDKGSLEFVDNGYGNKILRGTPNKEEKYELTATYKGTDTFSSLPYRFTLSVEEPVEEPVWANDFYLVLRVTQEDKQYAPKTVWQGIHVTAYDGGGFGFQLYDAPIADPLEKESDISFPNIDFGSGMTAAEIAKLRKDQEKKIKELSASAKMTESEYNLMVREFTDGNIRATLDGEVVSLLTEEESRQNKQPMMKVSGGGGFYVQGSVSELEKDNLKPGQEVTINDWNTGAMYTGTVESIGDFPTQSDGWNGMGNPNASYYPFRVFIDGTADLQEGSYVSVTYSAAEAENGVYLENPFLRTDEGEPYVYVRGKNGRLEKRTVTTGESLWGSYTEIRSGLTADDYVAFPYGKNVKPGAATEESDLSALYGY